MPRTRLSMRKLLEVLRLFYDKGLSRNQAARACNIARSTAQEYVRRFEKAKIGWPLPQGMVEADLNALMFYPPPIASTVQDPDWQSLHLELSRKGMTLKLLWHEYQAQHPGGYGYSRFCTLYGEWAVRLRVSMRQVHKAGEKIFVDYAGQTMEVINPVTGEVMKAEIFVASLGASSYIFAEATPSQELPNWLMSHVRAFQHLGGVPEIVVPDNLKSAVTTSCRYEPDINPSYQDLAWHFRVAVLPARAAKPKDKAKAEVSVQVVERWVIAPLRKRQFFSFEELNSAIAARLTEVNARPMREYGKSRIELFELMDRPALQQLPDKNFEACEWKKARVNLDYHVQLDWHYYSVPFVLAHKQIEIRFNDRIVEVYYLRQRVASHLRSRAKYQHTTCPEHMPKAHQAMHGSQAGLLTRMAKSVGPETLRMVETLIKSRDHPEQGYRSCLGLLRLAKTFGDHRLETACKRALYFSLTTLRAVRTILNEKQDLRGLPVEEPSLAAHSNIRGSIFYQ